MQISLLIHPGKVLYLHWGGSCRCRVANLPDGLADVVCHSEFILGCQGSLSHQQHWLTLHPKLISKSKYSLGLSAAIPTRRLIKNPINAITIGDLDGDSLADVILGSGTGIRILFNLGNSRFRLAAAAPRNGWSRP